MWQYAQHIAEDEDEDDLDPEPPSVKITPGKIRKNVEKIEQKIKDNPKTSNKVKAKLRYMKNNFAANLEKYEK